MFLSLWQRLNNSSFQPPKLPQILSNFLSKLQQKSTEIEILPHHSSFELKYRHTSLAIINSFASKEQAIETTKLYEIPLMHVCFLDQQQEEFVVKYFLNCFENSQILNQNFIFWPHFCNQKCHLQEAKDTKEIKGGFLQCYYNQQVYKTLRIKKLPADEQKIEQILIKLRSQFYFEQATDDRPTMEELLEKLKLAKQKDKASEQN